MADLARPEAVVVQRIVDAPPDAIVDGITEFAVDFGLQVDPRFDGPGMRFKRKRDAGVDGQELFRSGDELLVVIAPDPRGQRITCTATMSGLHQRGNDWKRGRALRGSLLSALFAYLGVKGLTPTVGVGDFVMFGLAGMFGFRTLRAVQHEEFDRTDFEDDVHRALAAMCDRIEASGDVD